MPTLLLLRNFFTLYKNFGLFIHPFKCWKFKIYFEACTSINFTFYNNNNKIDIKISIAYSKQHFLIIGEITLALQCGSISKWSCLVSCIPRTQSAYATRVGQSKYALTSPCKYPTCSTNNIRVIYTEIWISPLNIICLAIRCV